MIQGPFRRVTTDAHPCDEILVKLLGGFGNQLFQLAYALALSHNFDLPIRLQMQKGPFPFALEVLGIENNQNFRLVDGNFIHVERPRHSFRCGFYEYKHHGSNFVPVINPPRHLILNGYFQSEKYFDSIALQLREILIKKLSLTLINSHLEYVAHIRLGDYVRKRNISLVHGYIDESYLESALKQLGWSQGKPLIIVTDDVSSFRSLFPKYASLSYKIQSSGLLEDFRMIVSKQHKVISNSSFSWWAAWIGQGSVVAPKRWYLNEKLLENAKNDLFPKEWILL
jgi:Glycosyl transferase family 11